MPLNCMLQICKVTRVSKLFQRNFYLPLLRPLSPKDALRRHIITGKNLLGQKIEHYIPVLEEYRDRIQRRKYMIKGQGKKRQRKKASMKYVAPFFDDNMENHGMMQNYLGSKSKGRGQNYTYYIPDKNCTIVLNHQFERAIRDKDILDVVVAQRSEKIVVKLKNGKRVTLPLSSWDGHGPLYRGEGWTKKDIEEYHHHGKDTMSLAKLFEAKESGVEEWELEMMRMAAKRKTKHKGENRPEWKQLLEAAAENMDWDKFEDDAKEIVTEANDPVQDEPIAMQIDDMDKTKNVNEKLKNGGDDVLEMLPLMEDIPEVVKYMQDGEFTDIVEVSGAIIHLPLSSKEVFVAGQMVKSEEGEIFMPGQTVEDEETSEFTPGFTVLMDGEPTLLPGLVMGDDPNKAMFLPGDSTITETGELQFTETEDDRPREPTPPPEPEPEPEVDELELEELQNSEEEEEEYKPPPPPPPRKKKEFIYERPKRKVVNTEIKRREKGSKKPLISLETPEIEPMRQIQEIEPVLYDLSLPTFEKDTLLQEKERREKLTEKKSKEEWNIEKKKREIREKAKKIIANKPPPPVYEPLEPVRKSANLNDLEKSIKKGEFFTVDYKKFLNKERRSRVNWLEPYEYKNTFDSVGISRHRIWKSVVH